MYGELSTRMRDQELILRFLALYYNFSNYSRPIIGFLNNFIGSNRDLSSPSQDEITNVFKNTIEKINMCLGTDAFKPKGRFLAALFDAVMVGVARRLSKGEIKKEEKFVENYKQLLNNQIFLNSISTHTSDEENVKNRIEIATAAFNEIE
jgi:hypothetical protein